MNGHTGSQCWAYRKFSAHGKTGHCLHCILNPHQQRDWEQLCLDF